MTTTAPSTTADQLRQIFMKGLDAGATVRVRRPNSLFQLELPSYMGDGDGAQIYVRPRAGGKVLVTDLGATRMRISYESSVTPTLDHHLAKLAELHGFALDEGAFSAEVSASDLVPAALGLLQLEAVAERWSVKARVRQRETSRFRTEAFELLSELFPDRVEEQFSNPETDPDGLYTIDAVIHGTRELAIALVPNDVEGERAVSAKLMVESRLPENTVWLAIPRNLEKLRTETRLRLIRSYMPLGNSLADDHEVIRAKLRNMAA